jgi:transposase-like protein
MVQAMQQKRRPRAFTAAYKAEVVELCRKGDRSLPEIARDLDLTERSVRRWVEQAEIDAGRRPGLTSREHVAGAPGAFERPRRPAGHPPRRRTRWSRRGGAGTA